VLVFAEEGLWRVLLAGSNLFESVDDRSKDHGHQLERTTLVFGLRSGEESTVLVAPVFPAKGNFTKIGPFSETLPARTQLPDPLPDSSSWPEGTP
jgi:hypothetical protein